jgi:alkylhydroperoxidase family enzyme
MPLKSKHPRIAPVEAPYDGETAAGLDQLGPPIQLFRILARRPDRARAIAGWGSYYLSRRVALTLRQRELIIDRTTALCRADYEWGVHIAVFADKADLTSEQIDSLARSSAEDDCWTDPADRAVLNAVDDLYRSHDLGDETWAELVAQIGEDGAVDLVLICGWYHAISFAVRALRLPPEPHTPAFPLHVKTIS